MPEGPSIVILREAVEALHLKGKTVRHVEGNAKIDKDRLINQKVTDFRTRVHPLSQLGEMPDAKLKEMVKETRNYAFDFLEWKQEGTLKKHWLAHTKTTCPRCQIPFHKEYLGRTKRRSYFCENCQRTY